MKKIILLSVLMCISLSVICSCAQNNVVGDETVDTGEDAETFEAKVCDSGEYYTLLLDDFTYTYNIYDKSGKTVLTGESDRPTEINMIGDSIVDIEIGMGTGIQIHKYYSADENVFSDEFSYVMANSGRLIAYVEFQKESGAEDKTAIVVQDVFDETAFKKKFLTTYHIEANSTPKAYFSENGLSLQITYYSAEKGEDVSETFELGYKSFETKVFDVNDYQYFIDNFSSEADVGSISDAADAVKKAETIWIETYGKQVRKEKPYQVFYDENSGIWLIQGALRANMAGGVANFLVDGKTGKVLAVWHDK